MAVRRVWRWTIPAAAVATLSLMALLYISNYSLYFDLLSLWGVGPYKYPFLDFQYILAGAECWSHGIDVYVQDPCDALDRAHAYSPLWLRAGFLPPPSWVNAAGLVVVGGFLLSLCALPPPRRWRDMIITLLATLSTASAFAVERANVDLIMFALATVAGLLLLKPLPQRLVAYGAILLAGLLKFYPLALLLVAPRERPKLFVAIAAVALGVILLFAGVYRDELAQMAPNIPGSGYFDLFFGAQNLPFGLARTVQNAAAGVWPGIRGVPWESTAAFLLGLFKLVAGGCAMGLGCQTGFRHSLRSLPQQHAVFLNIGTILIVACFLMGQNLGYREIHFLFVLPGLLMLATSSRDRGLRIFFLATGIAIAWLMWEECFRHSLESAGLIQICAPGVGVECLKSNIALLFWFSREAVWWCTITVLWAIVIAQLLDTETVRMSTSLGTAGRRRIQKA